MASHANKAKETCPLCDCKVESQDGIPCKVLGDLVKIEIVNGNGKLANQYIPPKRKAHQECVLECLGLL